MEGIRDVPIGKLDGSLLGASLPDSLEKSCHARAKLYGFGSRIIV